MGQCFEFGCVVTADLYFSLHGGPPENGSPSIFSMGVKKIPFADLAVFHKNSGGGPERIPQKPGSLLIRPTFSGKMDRICCRKTGDVI